MRKLAGVLIAALLVLSLTGCGGGEAEAPTTEAPAPAPAPAPAQETAPYPDRSELSAEVFEIFPSDESVPAEVLERLETRQPMIIMFYNGSQRVKDDLRREVDKVTDDNRGVIDLISYDLGKEVSVDTNGQVVVDQQGFGENEDAQAAARFANSIGVDHVPYLIVVDNQGYKIFWSRGFIDSALLERQVERATR